MRRWGGVQSRVEVSRVQVQGVRSSLRARRTRFHSSSDCPRPFPAPPLASRGGGQHQREGRLPSKEWGRCRPPLPPLEPGGGGLLEGRAARPSGIGGRVLPPGCRPCHARRSRNLPPSAYGRSLAASARQDTLSFSRPTKAGRCRVSESSKRSLVQNHALRKSPRARRFGSTHIHSNSLLHSVVFHQSYAFPKNTRSAVTTESGGEVLCCCSGVLDMSVDVTTGKGSV